MEAEWEVFAGEVEAVTAAGIHIVVSVAQETAFGKYEAVGAFIIRHEGADLHESDIRDFCIGKISRYKIPKYIFFVKEFPMTGSGKIQKFKLKDIGLQLCKEQGIEII